MVKFKFLFWIPKLRTAKKLKALKFDLIKWNNEAFGRVEVAKGKVFEDIKVLDKKDEDFGLTVEEINQREEA